MPLIPVLKVEYGTIGLLLKCKSSINTRKVVGEELDFMSGILQTMWGKGIISEYWKLGTAYIDFKQKIDILSFANYGRIKCSNNAFRWTQL